MDPVHALHSGPIKWDIYNSYSMGCQGFMAMEMNIVFGLRPWTRFIYCHKPLARCYNYYIIIILLCSLFLSARAFTEPCIPDRLSLLD